MKSEYIPMPELSKKVMKKRLKEKYAKEEAEQKWQKIQKTYDEFVESVPDIGGRKNSMCNSFYGALACFAWYEALKSETDQQEMESLLDANMSGGAFMKKIMNHINLDSPRIQKIVYGYIGKMAVRLNQHKEDGSWNNTWGVQVNPLNRKEGISVHLIGCPIVDFAKEHGYMELMPIFCASDYSMIEEGMGKQLIREHTVAAGDEECDYWVLNRK